jgi:hypothetical protein
VINDLREAEADSRRRSNVHSATNVSITAKADLYGVAGEDAWIEWCGKKGFTAGPRPEARHKGVQFRSMGFGVKILCSPTPGHLLVKADTKEWADIYVLASYDPIHKRAILIGWLPGDCVRDAPVRDMAKAGAGYRLLSHAVKSRDLASLTMLEEVIRRQIGLTDVAAWYDSTAPATSDKPRPPGPTAAPAKPQQIAFDFGTHLGDRTR